LLSWRADRLLFSDWALIYACYVHGRGLDNLYRKTADVGPVFIVVHGQPSCETVHECITLAFFCGAGVKSAGSLKWTGSSDSFMCQVTCAAWQSSQV
jgi:hypothetical protein